MIKVLNNLFNRITEDEIYDIIKWKTMLESRKLGHWHITKIEKLNQIRDENSRIQKLDDLNYEYYRKKLDIYIDISISIRTKYLKPIKNKNIDINYLNDMWNWVRDEDNREIGKEDTIHMIEMMSNEIKTNVKLMNREHNKVIFLSIISGIVGSVITLLATN